MSNAVSARIDRLNKPLLRLAETHGRRLDEVSEMRHYRDEENIAWSPQTGADDFALVDRLADHVAGAFVPKNAPEAMHMLVKLPASVPVATREEAEAALKLAVQFANDTLGGNAVFAARIDRDERSLNNVDLFLAPRYEKVTKRQSKPAIAMTKHLKELATKRGRTANRPGPKAEMEAQGRALQDELADWLTARGFEAVRGEPKTTRGKDQKTPEEMGAQRDREAAEDALQKTRESEGRAAAHAAAARASELRLVNAEAKAEAVKRGQDKAREDIATERADLAREREAFETEKGEMIAVASNLQRIVQPILDMAKQWNEAIGIRGQGVRLGLGRKGEAAAETAASPEIGVLAAIMDRLKGVKR